MTTLSFTTPPPMVVKLIKAGQKAGKLVKYISRNSEKMRGNLGLGEMPLGQKHLPWAEKSLMAFHTANRASQVRHVIFSLPDAFKGTALEAEETLRNVARDWLTTYAPDRPWLFGFQTHNGNYHGHLAVSNMNAAGSLIKITPQQARDMAKMKFTTHASSAEGIGKPGRKTYTKTRVPLLLDELAGLLRDETGDMNQAALAELMDKGIISGFRRRKKDGALVSFEYGGRRIRFSSLERTLARKTSETDGRV